MPAICGSCAVLSHLILTRVWLHHSQSPCVSSVIDQSLASFSPDCPTQSPSSHRQIAPGLHLGSLSWHHPRIAPELKTQLEHMEGRSPPSTPDTFWGQSHFTQEKNPVHLKRQLDHRKVRHSSYITEREGKLESKIQMSRREMEQVASHLSFYSFHDVEYKTQTKLLDKQFCLFKFGPPNQPGHFCKRHLCYCSARQESTFWP